MMEFIRDHIELIVGVITVGVFTVEAVGALKKAKKIDETGTETDATVSRIDEIWDPDTASSSYTTYVSYTDGDGHVRESAMTLSSDIQYDVGEHVRIKYSPDEYGLVREVKN